MVDIGPVSSTLSEESLITSQTSFSSPPTKIGEKGEDYEKWSKEELIKKIRKLECHVFQLRNVIAKRPDSKLCFSQLENSTKRKREDSTENDTDNQEGFPVSGGRKAKKPRPFDFTQHETRHVAIKFLYLGWDYQGYACQEDTNDTIEAHLFKALTTTRLIEERSKSNYHRCGRTDKGVSAFQQVISIDLRSKVVDGKETVDYCYMLNRVLPKEIRVLGWAPVRPDFSARFDCNRRTYKYFFPRGNLDLQKMQKAADYLQGEHDFHNFCKPDKDKTTIRRIMKIEVIAPEGSDNEIKNLDMCKLVIVGSSFIWHQIRCIAAILILVGKELEEPEIVEELLDIKKHPKKPQYSMAIDYPLVLFDVQYPHEENIKWDYSENSLNLVLCDLQTIWAQHSIKTAMIREMMADVEDYVDLEKIPQEHVNSLIMGTKRKSYQRLLDRPVCGS